MKNILKKNEPFIKIDPWDVFKLSQNSDLKYPLRKTVLIHMMKNLILVFYLIIVITGCSESIKQEYYGIDVSHHNKTVVWNEVRKDKNIQFVYIKATEGKTYVDPAYKKNINEARKAGFKVGSYHFFRMTSGAYDQFRHFKAIVQKDEQDLLPMIDVETTDNYGINPTRDSLRVFLKLIENYYGAKPMIYGTNRSYNTICGTWFNRYKLYLGRYGKKPPVIKGKEHYLIWQYSENGIISGISKPVDLCRFHPEHSLKDILLKNKTR